MSTGDKSTHVFDVARKAGRAPFKVANLELATLGRNRPDPRATKRDATFTAPVIICASRSSPDHERVGNSRRRRQSAARRHARANDRHGAHHRPVHWCGGW